MELTEYILNCRLTRRDYIGRRSMLLILRKTSGRASHMRVKDPN